MHIVVGCHVGEFQKALCADLRTLTDGAGNDTIQRIKTAADGCLVLRQAGHLVLERFLGEIGLQTRFLETVELT